MAGSLFDLRRDGEARVDLQPAPSDLARVAV